MFGDQYWFTSTYIAIFMLDIDTRASKGVRKGLGLKPSLELYILRNLYYPLKGD